MNASVLVAAISVGITVLARLAMGGLAMQGLPLFPMFFSLGTKGARQHFRLICPQCGSSKPKGGDFLFTKAICKTCGTTWD